MSESGGIKAKGCLWGSCWEGRSKKKLCFLSVVYSLYGKGSIVVNKLSFHYCFVTSKQIDPVSIGRSSSSPCKLTSKVSQKKPSYSMQFLLCPLSCFLSRWALGLHVFHFPFLWQNESETRASRNLGRAPHLFNADLPTKFTCFFSQRGIFHSKEGKRNGCYDKASFENKKLVLYSGRGRWPNAKPQLTIGNGTREKFPLQSRQPQCPLTSTWIPGWMWLKTCLIGRPTAAFV